MAFLESDRDPRKAVAQMLKDTDSSYADSADHLFVNLEELAGVLDAARIRERIGCSSQIAHTVYRIYR